MKKDALDKNIAAYEAQLKKLEERHMGKWVVFHDCVLVDAFDTLDNAANEAVRRFGRGPYLIRKVGEPPARFLPRPVPCQPVDDIRITIKQIFQSCQKLTQLTGRPFSPDGHLVGSFGEVIARDLLNLTLMSPSNDGYDAIDNQERRVEIKATTRGSIALSASGTRARRLVVVHIGDDGDAEIAYDGPAAPAWDAAGKPQKNGQRSVSLSKLKKLADLDGAIALATASAQPRHRLP
ncbi:MAG: hypothetical protein OXU31_01845 [Gammaproteobacteria bacterium]|nr:hypothetical protein [Gammaproteobacteria bacterium]